MITVEPARPDNFNTVWQLLHEYFEEVQVMVRDNPSSVLASLQDQRSGIWIAYSECQPAGCIALRLLDDSRGEVKRLYVRPEFRRMGIAQKLLSTLEAHALTLRIGFLYLDTKDDLIEAIAFYRRAGYQLCERYNDNPQATMFLKKELVQSRELALADEVATQANPEP